MRRTVQSCVFLALLASRAASADPPSPPPIGCPTESAVRAELERILPGYSAAITVTDLESGVRLTVNGAERTFADPSRDCGERARAAALAAAMIIAPPDLPAVAAVIPPALPLETATPAASTPHLIDPLYSKGRSEVIAGGILFGASLLLGGVGVGLFGDGVSRSLDHLFEKGYDNSANAMEFSAGLTLAIVGGGAFVSGLVLTGVGAHRMRHPRSRRGSVALSLGSPLGPGSATKY